MLSNGLLKLAQPLFSKAVMGRSSGPLHVKARVSCNSHRDLHTMTSTTPPPGIYPPAPTFLKGSGSVETREEIDFDSHLQHALFMAKNGITGVVLFGTVGEMVHIQRAQKARLIEKIRKELDAKGFQKFSIIAGVAQNCIPEVIQDIDEYKKAGAKWAMTLTPTYFSSTVSQQGLIDWYSAVAGKSPLPIMVYYYPGVANNLYLSPQTLLELTKHPNVVGCKLSHGNLDQYAQVTLHPEFHRSGFNLMTGLNEIILPAVTIGVDGCVGAMGNVFPKLVTTLFELSRNGNIEEAKKLQFVVANVSGIIAAHGPIGLKYIIKRVLDVGESECGYLPLNYGMTEAQKAAWEKPIVAAIEAENRL